MEKLVIHTLRSLSEGLTEAVSNEHELVTPQGLVSAGENPNQRQGGFTKGAADAAVMTALPQIESGHLRGRGT